MPYFDRRSKPRRYHKGIRRTTEESALNNALFHQRVTEIIPPLKKQPHLLIVLWLLSEGWRRLEIAEIFGVSRTSVGYWVQDIEQIVGVRLSDRRTRWSKE